MVYELPETLTVAKRCRVDIELKCYYNALSLALTFKIKSINKFFANKSLKECLIQ